MTKGKKSKSDYSMRSFGITDDDLKLGSQDKSYDGKKSKTAVDYEDVSDDESFFEQEEQYDEDDGKEASKQKDSLTEEEKKLLAHQRKLLSETNKARSKGYLRDILNDSQILVKNNKDVSKDIIKYSTILFEFEENTRNASNTNTIKPKTKKRNKSVKYKKEDHSNEMKLLTENEKIVNSIKLEKDFKQELYESETNEEELSSEEEEEEENITSVEQNKKKRYFRSNNEVYLDLVSRISVLPLDQNKWERDIYWNESSNTSREEKNVQKQSKKIPINSKPLPKQLNEKSLLSFLFPGSLDEVEKPKWEILNCKATNEIKVEGRTQNEVDSIVSSTIEDHFRKKYRNKDSFLSNNNLFRNELIIEEGNKYHKTSEKVNGFSIPKPKNTSTKLITLNALSAHLNPIKHIHNKNIIDDEWEEKMAWNEKNVTKLDENLIYDKNDKDMVFEDVKKERQKADRKQNVSKIDEQKDVPEKVKLEKQNNEEATNFHHKSLENPYNLSNDKEYIGYDPMTTNVKVTSVVLKHSLPAVNLDPSLFRTDIPNFELKELHRKRYNFNDEYEIPIQYRIPKGRHKKKDKVVEKKADLSSHDHKVLLFEHIEKNPPLLSIVGMASRIVNYYKKDTEDLSSIPRCVDGETVVKEDSNTLPLIAPLEEGKFTTTLENNLYNSQVFKKQDNPCDFLLSTRKTGKKIKLYIREASGVYVCGHTQPLREVYEPNMRPRSRYQRNRVSLFMFRYFLDCLSRNEPARIKLDELKDSFPTVSESSIRKVFKEYTDSKKDENDVKYGYAKKELSIPSEESLRALVVPEMVCQYESMLHSQIRLEDLGIGMREISAAYGVRKKNLIGFEKILQFIDIESNNASYFKTKYFIDAAEGKDINQIDKLPVFNENLTQEQALIVLKQIDQLGQFYSDEIDDKVFLSMTDEEASQILLERGGISENRIKRMTRLNRKKEAIKVLENEKLGHKGTRKDTKEIIKLKKAKELLHYLFSIESRKLEQEIPFYDENAKEHIRIITDVKEPEGLKILDEKYTTKPTPKKQKKNEKKKKEDKKKEDKKKVKKDNNGEMSESSSDETSSESESDVEPTFKEKKKVKVKKKRQIVKLTRKVKNSDGTTSEKIEYVRDPLQVQKIISRQETKERELNEKKKGKGNSSKQVSSFGSATRENSKLKGQVKRYRMKLHEENRKGRSALDGGKGKNSGKSRKLAREKQAERKLKKAAKMKGQTTYKKRKQEDNDKKGYNTKHVKFNTDFVQQNFTETSLEMQNIQPEKDKQVYFHMFENSHADKGKSKTCKSKDDKSKSKKPKTKKPKSKNKKRKAVRISDDDNDDMDEIDSSRLQSNGSQGNKLKKKKKRRKTSIDEVSTILLDILNQVKEKPYASGFLNPVDTSIALDYKKKIRNPIDLSQIERNIRDLKYLSDEPFLKDVALMRDNAIAFCKDQFLNVPKEAKMVFDECKRLVDTVKSKITEINEAPITPRPPLSYSTSSNIFDTHPN